MPENWWLLLLIPLISALIGWLTNKLAISMLFRPRKQVRVFFWRWQGMIPKRREQIAREVGEIVERELLNRHDLRKLVEQADLNPHLESLAAHLVHENLARKLGTVPVFGNVVSKSKIMTLVETLLAEELKKEGPPLLVKMADEMESQINVRHIVEKRLEALDLDELERLVHQVASREFRMIEWLGGIVGFAIGLVQVAILWLANW